MVEEKNIGDYLISPRENSRKEKLHCTMFQAQSLVYRTYGRTTFRTLHQTSLQHQKQASQ